MTWTDSSGFFGAGVALTAGASVLVLITYWWNSNRKRSGSHDNGQDAAVLHSNRNGSCIRYEDLKHSPGVDNGKSKYLQIVQDLNNQLEEERIKRETAETRCQKYQTELDSLNSEHTALQDSHEKLLKQYNNVALKFKALTGRHRKVFQAINSANLPAEVFSQIPFDEDDSELEELRNEPDDSSQEVREDVSDQSEADLDLDSDNNSEQGGVDFELTENVMHALISRGSVTELLNGPLIHDPDDLSDLVGKNISDADADLDEIVSNNSQYSQEEDEEQMRRTESRQSKGDVNGDHIPDVKSTRQMWESLIAERDSPVRSTGSPSRSSSNRSSPIGHSRLRDDDVIRDGRQMTKNMDVFNTFERSRNGNQCVDNQTNDFNELKKQWESATQSNSEEEA